MAVLTPRLVLICTVPAVVTLLTILWNRRRRTVARNNTSMRKPLLTSAQEALVDETNDVCLRSENSVLKDNATISTESFDKDQLYSLIPEVTECLEGTHLNQVAEIAEEVCSTTTLVEDNASVSSKNFEKEQLYSLKENLTDVSQDAETAAESQCHECHPSVCVQKDEDRCSASGYLNPDVQHVAEVKTSRDQINISDECIVTELPNVHMNFEENLCSAKVEDDCPISPEVSRAGDDDDDDREVNIEEGSCDDSKQGCSKQERHFSEESRDSAMGGEEEFAIVESSVCGLLESAYTASSDSPVRTEFRVKPLEPEQQTHESTGSDLDEILESPPQSIYSDEHSEGSCDSGKGGSDIHIISSSEASQLGENALLIYEFEIPQDLCGRLIGRLGKHVNSIKSSCNANVFIKRHPFNSKMKLCALQGTKSEIQNALDLIRKRFPLSQFPAVTLVQVNIPLGCGVIVPETLQLHLPEGVTCDVILSSMVSAGHFFIQQPTHPTYPSLNRLDMCMTSCYTQLDTPQIPHPVEVGVICACPVLEGWFRAQVVNLLEDSEECDIKFVDYGGYSSVPLSRLRQIRSDFMTLPFQASECYLANVTPVSESWSLEACATFEELAQGQILQALVVGHAEDGIPYVHLYRVQGVSTVFINRELVNRGVARWLEAES